MDAGGDGSERVALRILRRILDPLLPPRCPGCRVLLDEPGAFCPACWRELDFILAPICRQCGLPLPVSGGFDGRQSLCAGCLARPPVYDRARAAVRYEPGSRRLVLSFKHGDRTELATALARLMHQAGAALVEDAQAIVPVPLHRWRLLRRRYNQAALLARAIARYAGRPYLAHELRRIRATPSQGGRSRAGRWRNVAGAFRARSRHIAGRRVLLVDDVMTTGATLEAAARACLAAGACGVDALVFARVVREGD